MAYMKVDVNKKWTSIYHLTVRHLILGIFPLLYFFIFYISLISGSTGIDWNRFVEIRKSYVGLYLWYFKYWSYLYQEDTLKFTLRGVDLLLSILRVVYFTISGYIYYPVYLLYLQIVLSFKKLFRFILDYFMGLSYGVGDFFISIFLICSLFFSFIKNSFIFIYSFLLTGFRDLFSFIYLLLIDEIYYNYLVAVAFYVLSNHVHSGGSKYLTVRRFFEFLFKGLSIGAYGVHFQPSLENSTFGKFFRFIRRGPYMWKNEEPKLSTNRLDHFFRVILIRFLVVFYFFLPDGEEYRRRSVLWQLLISDLPEDRYIDFSLTPGLRYQAPLYFFVYSNFFAIDVQEYSEIVFNMQQEELIYFLWVRKKYFTKLRERLLYVFDFIYRNLYYIGVVGLKFVWWLCFMIYFMIYFIRSFIIILLNIIQILVLNFFVVCVYLLRQFYIFQINSLLYVYRKSTFFAKILVNIYDIFLGIFFFVLLFVLVIGPLHYYIIQTFWAMGGIFLAYFYIIWVPLLILAGVYDDWKLVLHEIGEFLFVACFHMGGWSVLFLRIELTPRHWFLEPEYELNPWGPMAQEYQGFYMVYAGWFMDLFYTIFMA